MLGHVTHVDTEQIIIEIENSNLMNKICVGNLVAIETSKQHENLIALIDKVTRSIWRLIWTKIMKLMR